MSKNLILSRKELKPSSFSIRNPLQMHMSNTTYKKKEYNIENKIILSNDFYFDKDAKTIESESIKDTTTNLYFSARKDNLNQKTITLYKCNDTHRIDEKEIEIFDIKDNIGLSLKKFTKKLTDIDKIKKTDPVVGRTDEIKRVIQILCRRRCLWCCILPLCPVPCLLLPCLLLRMQTPWLLQMKSWDILSYHQSWCAWHPTCQITVVD